MASYLRSKGVRRAGPCSGAQAVLVLSALVLAGAFPAGSAGLLTIRLDRGGYAPGQLVNLTVGDVATGDLVLLEVSSDSGATVHLDAATADARGQAYFQFRIPVGTATGVFWTLYASAPSAAGTATLPIVEPPAPLPPTPVILPPLPPCGPWETGTPPSCVFKESASVLTPESVAAGDSLQLVFSFANPRATPIAALLAIQIVDANSVAPPPQLTVITAFARSGTNGTLRVFVPLSAAPGPATVQIQILSALPSQGGEALYFATYSVEVV